MRTNNQYPYQEMGLQAIQLLWNESLSTSVYEGLVKYIYEQLSAHLSTVSLFVLKESDHFVEEHFLANQYNVRELNAQMLNKQVADVPTYASHHLYENDEGYFLKIPLHREKEVIGILEVFHKWPFEDDLVDTLLFLSEIISVSIANIMTSRKADELLKAINTLADIPQLLIQCTQMKELIITYGKHIVKNLKLDRMSVFLYLHQYEKNPYKILIDFRGRIETLDEINLDIPEMNQTTKLEALEGYWVPVFIHNQKMGYILYDNIYSAYNINNSVRDTLPIYTTQFAVAAENLMLLNDMKIMAEMDILTGLYNRNYFEKLVTRLEHKKYQPYSVIIGDVNGLKIINDVFGHAIGDQLLVMIAKVLTSSINARGTLARWGGDEFIVYLPCVSEGEAASICQTVMEACKKLYLKEIHPSISLGYSTSLDEQKPLLEHIIEAEDMMYRDKLMDKNSFRNNFISTLKGTLHEKCQETEDHLERLNIYTEKISIPLNLSGNDQNKLKLLAYLHDIGKVSISDTILNKPGRLTAEEYEIMKTHCEAGYRIVNSAPELAYIADLILYHHEHWNGKGYPRGLKENEIPLLSRIIAIIDAYDVMRSKRSYKDPHNHEYAINELLRCSGTQFDPGLIEIICRNNGEILLEAACEE